MARLRFDAGTISPGGDGLSDNANEDPGRARNAPNKRAHPARLDQFARGMPATQDSLDTSLDDALDFRVSSTNPARQQGKDLHAPARSDVTFRHEHE